MLTGISPPKFLEQNRAVAVAALVRTFHGHALDTNATMAPLAEVVGRMEREIHSMGTLAGDVWLVSLLGLLEEDGLLSSGGGDGMRGWRKANPAPLMEEVRTVQTPGALFVRDLLTQLQYMGPRMDDQVRSVGDVLCVLCGERMRQGTGGAYGPAIRATRYTPGVLGGFGFVASQHGGLVHHRCHQVSIGGDDALFG